MLSLHEWILLHQERVVTAGWASILLFESQLYALLQYLLIT